MTCLTNKSNAMTAAVNCRLLAKGNTKCPLSFLPLRQPPRKKTCTLHGSCNHDTEDCLAIKKTRTPRAPAVPATSLTIPKSGRACKFGCGQIYMPGHYCPKKKRPSPAINAIQIPDRDLFEGKVQDEELLEWSDDEWSSKVEKEGDQDSTITLGCGSRMAELKGVSEDQIQRLGHWQSGAMERHYLSALPRKAMRAMAGMDSVKSGDYYIRRDASTPPESLSGRLFADVDGWLRRHGGK